MDVVRNRFEGSDGDVRLVLIMIYVVSARRGVILLVILFRLSL
jgi:hypothetical protein